MWPQLPLHLVGSRSASSCARAWFDSEAFRSAFQVISEGLEGKAGLIVLLGDEGMGKSTLMRGLREVYAGAGWDTLFYDARAIQDPLRALQDDLRLRRPRDQSPDSPIAFLDGADRLSRERLAEIIALADRESERPVQLILSGRPELWTRLQLADHAGIDSLVRGTATLGALRRHEIGFYLRHRSLVAGRAHRRFEQAALERLYAYSGGNPGIANRVGDRLDGAAPETIGVADIDAVIATLEGGRTGGRLTVAQFGVADIHAPGQRLLSRPAGAHKRRGAAVVAVVLIATAALGAVSLPSWKDHLVTLIVATKRPVAPLSQQAEIAATSTTQAPATYASTEQVLDTRAPAAEPPPAAQAPETQVSAARLLSSSERHGSPGDHSGATAERAVSDKPPLDLSLRENSPDPAAMPDDAAAPQRSNDIAENLVAVASPAAPPERAPGSINEPRADPVPAPTVSQAAAEISPAKAPLPPISIGQTSAGDEPVARDPAPWTADPSLPPASVDVAVPLRDQPAPPAEAPSARASAAPPPARRPIVAQSASGDAPTSATTPVKAERRPEADAFMKRGMQLLDAADVASARLLFERAAELGLPEACTAMGETFDPAELGRRRIIGIGAQPDIALKWYHLGDQRGDPRARERISRLAGSVR
jgi:hypothetical protein